MCGGDVRCVRSEDLKVHYVSEVLVWVIRCEDGMCGMCGM